MTYQDIFPKKKTFIGCVHLLPLPGAPLYDGNLGAIYEQALQEAALLETHGAHGLIIENFRDKPFYPDRLPAETIASLAAIGREVVRSVSIPVGVNALRNDATAAMSIATAIGAHFIRVNVHMGAVVSDQGILQGRSYETLRLKQQLRSKVLIFADVRVKHSSPLGDRGLDAETKDLSLRGMVDALIVSGSGTGSETSPADLTIVKANTSLPVLVGSGITPENIDKFSAADGFIVGSCFKKDGNADNPIDETRLKKIMPSLRG